MREFFALLAALVIVSPLFVFMFLDYIGLRKLNNKILFWNNWSRKLVDFSHRVENWIMGRGWVLF